MTVATKTRTREQLAAFRKRLRAKAHKMEVVSLTATEARQSLSVWVSKVGYGGQLVQIERHGKAIAGLVPAEYLELLRQIEDQIDIRAALAAMKEGRGKSWEKLKAELGL